MSIKKTSEIKINVHLDENNMPADIDWFAQDASHERPLSSKAMLLSFFDRKSRETLKLDLWTKDMQVDEMDRFFFYTLKSMADTYQKATQNKGLADAFRDFTNYFGEITEIIPKKK